MARPLTAEFIGTFALIFIGTGSAITLDVNHDPPVAFAHGLTILAAVMTIRTDLRAGIHLALAADVAPTLAAVAMISTRLTRLRAAQKFNLHR